MSFILIFLHLLRTDILLFCLQLFWEKKLSGLNAYDIAEELVKTMELPKGLQGNKHNMILIIHNIPLFLLGENVSVVETTSSWEFTSPAD